MTSSNKTQNPKTTICGANSKLSCCSGAPLPLLMASEHDTYLMFGLAQEMGVGILLFKNCLVAKLGYPNDEALPGHPLYEHGLKYYELQIAVNSPWIGEIEDMNSATFRDQRGLFSSCKHYIFPFHDSTFECLADSFRELKVDSLHAPTLKTLNQLFDERH